MRKLLAKVEDGRFGRALAGFVAGWQWECKVRREGEVHGLIRYSGKEYRVVIAGRRARCSCADFAARGLFCKHIGVCGCGGAGRCRPEVPRRQPPPRPGGKFG
ncbi:SWIM zinc finger [Desulfofundulus australicus DSM 11792]|uniref:SWIM zinc finger n=1 Tax=Desulfofundulus australicus DSM 11792 TaxID=1121425 RepID=A0A1M4UDP9_9FIRM|nr:SWIM zinc finger family protein [Desulfofundulus australicus]SHE54865.1 SWIM zinc finger [Desulfofundulus australicus DSM 11792]